MWFNNLNLPWNWYEVCSLSFGRDHCNFAEEEAQSPLKKGEKTKEPIRNNMETYEMGDT
jgi:hypothetical protein